MRNDLFGRVVSSNTHGGLQLILVETDTIEFGRNCRWSSCPWTKLPWVELSLVKLWIFRGRMINTCKIFRVIAIRTYWAEQLIFWSKMRISAQYVLIVRIGHSYVLGSNKRRGSRLLFGWFELSSTILLPLAWIGRVLFLLNLALNPLIYNASNPRYRLAFKHQAFRLSRSRKAARSMVSTLGTQDQRSSATKTSEMWIYFWVWYVFQILLCHQLKKKKQTKTKTKKKTNKQTKTKTKNHECQNSFY